MAWFRSCGMSELKAGALLISATAPVMLMEAENVQVVAAGSEAPATL